MMKFETVCASLVLCCLCVQTAEARSSYKPGRDTDADGEATA
jgi:hypothetical protein